MPDPKNANPLEKELKKFFRLYGVTYIKVNSCIITSNPTFPPLCIQITDEYVNVRRVTADAFTFSFPCNTVAAFLQKILRFRLARQQDLLRVVNRKSLALL